MFRRRPKGEEGRFVGNGNSWVGDDKKYRGWRLICSSTSCGNSKIVTSHNAGGSMPPHVIIRKFEEAGWLVGRIAEDDLCPKCYREYTFDRRAQRDKIKPAVVAAVATVAAVRVAEADHKPVETEPIKNQAHELALLAQLAMDTHDFNLVNDALDAIAKLCAVLPKEAFETQTQTERILRNIGFDVDGEKARAANGHSTPIKPYKEPPKMADADFDKWLSEQQTTHDQHKRKVSDEE